ncbi:acetylglutamate kinase [Parashewanella curva]|uniref:Acetylglutamate kinase n=1 Tax=Parashewanella curva TaxID=2338552 RepID=A0A3L8PWT4_9GAMM|nr:acetylglutamate kinase [Parashewanella curva]RLV58502.1 acetylglutamate kinase [Parashewanella curva]
MTKPLVIKIGGSILEQESALSSLLLVLKSNSDKKIILVHGGGSTVDQMLMQAGFTTKKKNGLRVTPKAQTPIIIGALAGTVNKKVVATANQLGLTSLGLSLADAAMVTCSKHPENIGEVGVPTPNNYSVIELLLSQSILPVIASIGALDNGNLVNVNADDAAVAITQLVDGDLLLLTDVAGVKDAQGKILKSLAHAQAQTLIEQQIINGGMVAKVNAAFNAARQLRRSIAIASWQQPQQLSLLFVGQPIGTRIIPD